MDAMEELFEYRRGQKPHPAARPSRGETNNSAGVIKSHHLFFLLWWVVMPGVVFWATLAMLCMQECSALPWLTFGIAPKISLLLGIVGCIAYWMWTLRLPGVEKRRTRWYILSSIVWGPVAGGIGIVLVTMVLQAILVVWALIRAGAS